MNEALIFADKTRNLYRMDRSTYDKLHTENVTKSYKKAEPNIYNNINLEAKKIAIDLKIADKVECLAKKEAFITLKDHKDDFNTNTKCRLINPAKSELGKVSKAVIEKINIQVKNASGANQWKNTGDVIKWFDNINDKGNCIFVQFDIAEFYPSISKDLVLKSIDYAKQFATVTQKDIDIIMHARKSLLFAKDNIWIKNTGDPTFDVTMGSFDGAELCEMVGLYMLNTLGDKFGHERLGLYRDLPAFTVLVGPHQIAYGRIL